MMNEKNRGNCNLCPGINCESLTRPCSHCGWNPKVSERRLEKIRAARQIALLEGKR